MFRKIKYSIMFYKYQVNRQNWWIMLYFNLLSNNWMNYIQQGLPTSSLCIVSLTLWFLRRHWHIHSLKKYCIVIDGFCFIWVESKNERGGGGKQNVWTSFSYWGLGIYTLNISLPINKNLFSIWLVMPVKILVQKNTLAFSILKTIYQTI